MTDKCETLRTDLGGYVIGGLTEEQVARVDAHLEYCADCRAELSELAGIPELLELTVEESPPVPADLRDRIVSHPTLASKRRPGMWLVAAAGIVGLVLGAAAVIGIVTDPPPDRRAILSAEDTAAVGLTGRAELRDTPSGVRVELEASGLRPDPDIAYYHVWLEWPDGQRLSAGTVLSDGSGNISAALTCGGALDDYSALTITAHPYRHSDGEVLARAALE